MVKRPGTKAVDTTKLRQSMRLNSGTKWNSLTGFLIFALLLTLNSTLHTTASAAEKGTLAIPKRGTSSDMEEIVDKIQKTFTDIKDIQGSFSQTSYIKDLEQTQQYSGAFFIKKPSQAMWEYATPRDEKIIVNDTDTFIYKKAENQVIRTKISKEAYSQAPITLLSRFENIRADFEISMPDKNGLQLIPKTKIGFIKTLVLETAPEGFPVKMFTIIDTYGNIIMIELQSIKINSGLDDEFFKFEIPAGAEVYDMNQ